MIKFKKKTLLCKSQLMMRITGPPFGCFSWMDPPGHFYPKNSYRIHWTCRLQLGMGKGLTSIVGNGKYLGRSDGNTLLLSFFPWSGGTCPERPRKPNPVLCRPFFLPRALFTFTLSLGLLLCSLMVLLMQLQWGKYRPLIWHLEKQVTNSPTHVAWNMCVCQGVSACFFCAVWGEENTFHEKSQCGVKQLPDGFSRLLGRTAVPLLRLSAVSLFSISAISSLLPSPSFYILWVYSVLCCVLTSYFRFTLKQLTYLSDSTHKSLHVVHAQSSVGVLVGNSPYQLSSSQRLRDSGDSCLRVSATWGSPWHCLSSRWGCETYRSKGA